MKQTSNTITVPPSLSKKPTTYSKRDLAAKPEETVETNGANKERMAKGEKVP